MPTRLQQARYDGLLRRVGDLKGPGSKVSEVLGDVFPVLELENVPAELYALNGWNLGYGSIRMVPGGANNNITQIFNPPGSQHLVVPTRILISTGASGGQIIEYDTDVAGLTDLFSTSKPRDTRKGVFTSLVAELRQDVIAGSLPPNGQIFVAQDTTFDWEDLDGLFVLSPGTGLDVGTTVQNVELIVNFHWRERIAEPSELNF